MFSSREACLWHPAAVMAIVAALTSACSRSIPVQMTAGANFEAVVQLPGGTKPPDAYIARSGLPTFDWNSRMEFRLRADNDRVLFFRVYQQDHDGVKYYGDHPFALEHIQKFQVRQAAEEEWMGASLVDRPDWSLGPREWDFSSSPFKSGLALADGQAFVFEGKRYPYQGAPGRFILSPHHSRLATFTTRVGSDGGQFNSAPFTYFLTIYDVATGRLLSSVQGDLGKNQVSYVTAAEELSWVTDRYFYMPLSREHDEILFFDFRDAR